jgi:hypothetical protein
MTTHQTHCCCFTGRKTNLEAALDNPVIVQPWAVQIQAMQTGHTSQTKDGRNNQMKGGTDIKCDTTYQRRGENSIVITPSVLRLLIYNMHMSGDLAGVELFS